MTTMTLDTLFDSPRLPRVSRPAVRLTRRGRIVVVLAALVVAVAIGVFVTAAGSVATQRPGSPEPTKIVQVGNVRAVMEEIKQLNALDSGVLQAGQRLVVPAG